MREEYLVQESFKILMKRKDIIACQEVPILGRSVDIAYLYDNKLITVEFKLNDWKRALIQAKDHLVAADFAYICMPYRTVSEKMKIYLQEAGVGLLFYTQTDNWPFEEIIKAEKSKEIWQIAKEETIKYMRKNQVQFI